VSCDEPLEDEGSRPDGQFASARARMEKLRSFLQSEEAAGLSLAELEALLEFERRKLVDTLMHDRMELDAERHEAAG
jgi:hypothetical protein